jgi:hypothetical protein
VNAAISRAPSHPYPVRPCQVTRPMGALGRTSRGEQLGPLASVSPVHYLRQRQLGSRFVMVVVSAPPGSVICIFIVLCRFSSKEDTHRAPNSGRDKCGGIPMDSLITRGPGRSIRNDLRRPAPVSGRRGSHLENRSKIRSPRPVPAATQALRGQRFLLGWSIGRLRQIGPCVEPDRRA